MNYIYFNEVAETGSNCSAAVRLHIATSAINRQISLLKHIFGIMPLERSNTGILGRHDVGTLYVQDVSRSGAH
ncbi:helix-turn-helix domain-containing protein [Acerihabitans arboris]|uniref:helix-turn-helix domain-containing protein n=1 Tax=Acerihabitans arboris TaxID=2691583 RepID=UPI001FE94DC7|nr:LysR family transcriptional regulator [Acerihabitans arboris]